jgi:ferredoxin
VTKRGDEVSTFQISASALPHLIDAWRRRADVIAPHTAADGEVALAVLGPTDLPDLSFANVVIPPTRLLAEARSAAPTGHVVLLGLRPCDAAAIRARTADDAASMTIVTLCCARQRASCFCTLVGSGPSDDRGADVVAWELDGDLVMTPRTTAGEALLATAHDVLAELAPAEAERALGLVEVAHEPRGAIDRAGLDAASGSVDDAPLASTVWAELARVCLACEVCTRLCPVIAATPVASAERWLSRLRRLLEPSPANPACVGCGRCVRYCPAGIDLRAALREIALAADFCDPA